MGSSPIIKKVWTSDVGDLISRLSGTLSMEHIAAPYFVFKVNESLRINLAGDDHARHQIVSRYPGKVVYLLEYDGGIAKHKIYEVKQEGLKLTENAKLLDDIREFDLLEIINKSDCIIKAPDGTHFITPSEKHTKKFLRLADALHSYDALDRISYWLQAEMNGVAGVLIDTWGLASIVLGSQLLLGKGEKVPFDCFRRHIKNNEVEAHEVLSGLGRRMTGDGPLLCLISISSSGSFINSFEKLITNSNIRNPTKVLSLYKFEDTPKEIEAWATLDFPLDWHDESECPDCNAGGKSKIYQIDPKFYYPREHKEETIRFTSNLLVGDQKGSRSAASQFIHDYGMLPGVLRVHREDPNDGIKSRHHAFYIDVFSLLQNESFKQVLCSKLKEINSGNGGSVVIVVPPHNAGMLLAKIAGDLLGATCISHHTLRKLKAEDKKLITSAHHLIFLDDVLISGTRIRGYLKSLREEFSGDDLSKSLEKITWFPIIARPSDAKVIAQIKDSLSGHTTPWRNEFTFLYEIILPEWTDDKLCPWCQEATVFQNEVGGKLFEEPSWYAERRNYLLYSTEEGISENPLFLLPGVLNRRVGSGSRIAEEGSSEMQVLFLLATALQNLRNDAMNPLGPGLMQSNVLSMIGKGKKMDVFPRYCEELFQASFLRTVKAEEWSQSVKHEGVDHLASLMNDSSSHGVLAGESILFLHRLKSSRMLSDGFEKALEKWNDDEVVNLLVRRFKNPDNPPQKK